MKTLSPYARMRRACGARRRVLALAAGLLPLLPGAASRVGRAAVIGPPPAPHAPYAYDDGTDEQAIGVSSDPPEPYSTAQTAWMNAFVVTPGHETINALYVAYGSYAQGSNGIPNGQPAHVFLLSDSNNDGNPADAQVVRDITSSVSNVDNGTFNRVPITPVTMLPGQVFFVGAIVTGLPLDRYPGPVDTDGGTHGGQAWLAAGRDGSFGLTNLSTAEYFGNLDDFFGPGQNAFLVRADAVAAPEPSMALPLAAAAVLLTARRRKRQAPPGGE
jgi:hypothetical protein